MKPLLLACAAGAFLPFVALQDEPETATLWTWKTKIALPADETGSIKGSSVYDGEPPEPKPDLQPKEEETAGCIHHDQGMDLQDRSLLIDEKGGIANVVLTIEVKDAEVELPEEPILMDQLHCRFEPHVLMLPVGAKIRYGNSDETNHNIHTYARKNSNINNNVAGGSHYDMVLDKVETFEVKCDIHPWMSSWVVVTDATHCAKSAADGSFELTALPPGTYKVSWWHETLGKGKSEEVTVEAGATAELSLELKEKEKKGRRR